MDFSCLEIPEEQINPEDSSLLKDTRIPLCYKNQVAQELYNVEEEEIKQVVRSKRKEDTLVKTVYNTSDEENISSLSKNVVNVVRNAEHKCAAKGILWLACPTALAAGKPVGHFQCVGETPNGQDFEAFISAEKALEFKALFSSWVYMIYHWALFTTGATVGLASVTMATTSRTPGNLTGTMSLAPELSGPPDQPVIPLNQSVEPADLSATFNQSRVVQSGVTLNQSDVLLTDVPLQPDLSDPLVTSTFASELPETNLGVSPPILDIANPSPPPVAETQQATAGQLCPRADVRLLNSPLGDGVVTQTDTNSSSKLLAGVDEPIMVKLGNLSNVIEHWYELEGLLGFPGATPTGFPMTTQPVVVRPFYKNRHNY
ncbi:hypothetical protein BDM02DRAFT_3133146 [Thelephora ganbajun]|uniref:Uncharacterized protein n=1 Tax=Thelephora ganbajun TaxID=370292 RepID=A0ACB6YYP0_THEGA|nr:hypothetical protein BDM02DRAFT_3133146 [Thelephora ganbajun]